MTDERVDQIFTYRAPFGTQAELYTKLRDNARVLANQIQTLCPDSKEKAFAITSLQQTIMWANASIAIHEQENQ